MTTQAVLPTPAAPLPAESELVKKAWTKSVAQLKRDAEDDELYKTRDIFGKKKISWKSGKYKGKPKRATLAIEDLYPSQNTVSAAVVYMYYTGKRKDKTRGPNVVVIDGKYVIADGHHRATADIIKGKKKLRVNIYPTVVGIDDADKVVLASRDFDKLVNRIVRTIQAPEILKARRHHMRIEPGRPTVKMRRARRRFNRVMTQFFAKAQATVIAGLHKHYTKLRKADDPKKIAAMIYDDIEWGGLADDAEAILKDIAQEAGMVGIGQLGIEDQNLFDAVNTLAESYAQDRAAEMVGMRWVDGELVANPDAQWAISETTREDLRDVITQAFEDNTPMKQLIDEIQQSGMFSDARAKMIARTEAAMAQVQGNLGAWEESGVVRAVNWVTAGDHDVDDECDEYEAQSPWDIGEVPDLPAHPNCECALVPVEVEKLVKEREN